MNQAIEMLRNRAVKALDYFLGEQGITLEIDPIEPSVEQQDSVEQKAPLEVNLIIHKPSEDTRRMAYGLTESVNPNINYRFDQLNALTTTNKRVWIYNISGASYSIHGSLYKDLKVPACKNEEYVVVTSLPLMHRTPVPRLDVYEMAYQLEDGRRLAQDLLNPESFGLDQNAQSSRYSLAIGTNYQDRGLFWSTHNPPLKSELRYAHKRLKKYYTSIMEQVKVERMAALEAKINRPSKEIELAEQYLSDATGNKI